MPFCKRFKSNFKEIGKNFFKAEFKNNFSKKSLNDEIHLSKNQYREGIAFLKHESTNSDGSFEYSKTNFMTKNLMTKVDRKNQTINTKQLDNKKRLRSNELTTFRNIKGESSESKI